MSEYKEMVAVSVNPGRAEKKYLPGYARFLLENKIERFTDEMVKFSRDAKLPLLVHLENISLEQRREMAIQHNTEFLSFLANDRINDFISLSVNNWVSGKLQLIERDQIGADDILLVGYVRKKCFLKFLPDFTSNLGENNAVIAEIDEFTAQFETACLRAFHHMQQASIEETAAQLRYREEQLLEAQELADMGSYEVNFETRKVKVTPQLSKILSLKEGDTLDGFLKMDKVHPVDRERLKSAVDKAMQETGFYDCEYRYFANGAEKVLWARGVVNFTGGKAATMRGTMMDVTARRHTIKRLERSQELYEEAQKLTHIGNWIWLLGEDKVSWSDELYRIYGLEPQSEQINFERFLSFVHHDDREMVNAQVQHALSTHEPNDFYHRVILGDGTVKILHAKGEVLVNENGKPFKMMGTGQDVTKQKQAEAELTESKNKLVQLYAQLGQNYEELENSYTELIRARKQLADDRTRFLITVMPHIVASAAPDGSLDYANQHLMDFTGIPFDELKGWGWAKCIYPEDLERLTAGWKHSLETGKPLQIEFRMVHKAGKPFWHLAKVKPHHDEKGEITMWIATITDIHEQKMMEEKKDEFISIASHELKTPLTSVKAYLQLLENHLTGSPDKESSLYVEKANTSINRLHALISELLDISKIQHGKLPLTFHEFDFNEMLNETIELIQQTSPRHTIHKTGEVHCLVVGDKERLRQVCINLLTNAVKYSPQADRVEVKITNDRDETLIAVTDYGIGIPSSDLEKVFERFYRVQGTGAQYQGLGIGLFISAEIIQRHRGKLWVKSELDKGSTFYFTLPYKSQ